MRIGMLIDTYLPDIGGAEIHVLELSRALQSQGHDISILTATPLKSESEPPSEFPLLRLPGLTGGGRRAFINSFLAIPKLINFIRKVDFVHCHYSFLLAVWGTLLACLLGKRSAMTLHGLGTLDSSVSRSSLYRLYRYSSLKMASNIIATSQEMRSVALRFVPPERIAVIPNGVNTAFFTPAEAEPNPDELVILTMRRLAPKNGVQYLVEAAPAVVAAVPQARFWTSGEGKLEMHIRQRVRELGMEPYFRFIGIVPHAETLEFYRQADIVAFPSSAESTSLACLEAMSLEKAIVASSLAAFKLMLGENGERGLLVQLFDRDNSDYDAPLTLAPERIQALAVAIIQLAQNPELRQELGAAARRHVVGYYDWNVIARQTVQLYTP
jgi:glycosyltransferase involved in cell wall biosynthesis